MWRMKTHSHRNRSICGYSQTTWMTATTSKNLGPVIAHLEYISPAPVQSWQQTLTNIIRSVTWSLEGVVQRCLLGKAKVSQFESGVTLLGGVEQVFRLQWEIQKGLFRFQFFHIFSVKDYSDSSGTFTSLWAMSMWWRNLMAEPMSCMISDASDGRIRHGCKHVLTTTHEFQLHQVNCNSPLSVKAWSPRAWMRLNSSPPSILRQN